MIFNKATLADVWLIDIEPRGDARGFFARTMCEQELAEHGVVAHFVQQNMSSSKSKGTLRGLHYQREPYGEAKLVRCTRGAVVDAIIDLRGGSPTYLKHELFELTEENRRLLYVPPGFAHGYQTQTDDAEVSYLVSSPYTPTAEGGVRYDDPLIGIRWPIPVVNLGEKDAAWPLLVEGAPPPF